MTEQTSSPVGVGAVVGGVLGHLAAVLGRQTVRNFEEDARAYGPLNRRPLGLRSVPLDRITGSVGRARELGPDFLPIHGFGGGTRLERYEGIEDALARGVLLPPVQLYKLGYHYYVLDGNHRVAAMKKLTGNVGEIDAHVTQFLPYGDTEGGRVFVERRSFEQATGLTQVGAVGSGHYDALLRDLERHRARLQAEDSDVSVRDAARDWFAGVWLPRAEQIRRAGLRRTWPEKRTADIYVHILEHQANLWRRLGRALTWEEAFADFRSVHSPRDRRRLPGLRRLQRLAFPFRPGRTEATRPMPPDTADLERHISDEG